MWVLQNRTSYGAERNWIRDKNGVHHWLVAVQATFDITDTGRLKLSDTQRVPLLAPEHRGDPTTTSLKRDADLLAPKPGTDILLDAAAHAPGGRPAPVVPVSLRVGGLEKNLLVHGTRVYYEGPLGLTTTSPHPFVTAPIQYEWAFGGSDTKGPDVRKHRIDTRNPVGKGVAADRDHLLNQPAHAIEYPNGNFAKVGPAGFGPLASFWSPRLERAGTYDARWAKTKKPLLPDDYDERFGSSAPDDQWLAKPLRGGETVVLVNLTPEGLLRFDLPSIALAFTTRVAGRREEHGATLATVFVTPDARKVSVTWQSALMVPARDVDYLDVTTITEKPFFT